MAKYPQIMVEAATTARSLGKGNGLSTSDSSTLRTMFNAAPYYSPNGMTDDERRKWFEDNVLDGIIQSPDFGTFYLDYSGEGGEIKVPNYPDVDSGGEGQPASAWVPNPNSPAEGMDAATQPAAPEGFGTTAADQWGSGANAVDRKSS